MTAGKREALIFIGLVVLPVIYLVVRIADHFLGRVTP